MYQGDPPLQALPENAKYTLVFSPTALYDCLIVIPPPG
jgi:hypothetical protein